MLSLSCLQTLDWVTLSIASLSSNDIVLNFDLQCAEIGNIFMIDKPRS